LNDALARSIALLEQQPKSDRRIIIAFSDGFDTGSETSEDNLLQLLTGSDITVYGLGFSRTQALFKGKPKESAPSILDQQVTRPVGPGVVPTPTNADNTYGTPATLGGVESILRSAVGTPPLNHYASYTGGVFHSHWSEKALQEQLSRVASEIHSQYDLAYVPNTLNQPGFHHIEVRVSRPGLKVRARAGYYYAASKP
jgi:VWFA-related protein